MVRAQARHGGRPARPARLEFKDGRLVRQNAQARDMLGEYRVGTPIREIVDGASSSRIPIGNYLRVLRSDGTPMFVSGSWGHDALELRDQTAEYHAANRKSQMVRMLEDAQRLGQLGSWSWKPQDDSVVWSDEMYRLFGLEPQSVEMNYERYLSLIHPDDAQEIDDIIKRAFKNGGMYTVRHRVILPDGSIRHIYGQGIVEKNDDDQSDRVWGTSQDVTAQEEALEVQRLALLRGLEIEHLKELDRAKTQLLNTASHELNTPLTPLKLQLHLLTRDQDGLSKRQKKALAVLSRNVQRLAMLVADVLDVARITSGHLKVVPQAINTAHIAADSVSAFEPNAGEKNITLQNEVAGLEVMADPDRLGQVLDNLVSNALKFTPEGGTVTVRDGRKEDMWFVEVEDSGMGLTAEQMAQLFQPFSQVHDVGTITERGTGLGLFICRGIAEGHGGRIEMLSDGPGTGTKVTMFIPADASAVQAAAKTQE